MVKIRSMKDGKEELISQDRIINYLDKREGAVK